MKNHLFILVLASFSLAACSDDDNGGMFDGDNEREINAADLPTAVTDYVATHFEEHDIIRAVEDKDHGTLSYDVYLSDYVQLEFNSSSNITEIDGVHALPASVIPEPIRNYVGEHYPEKYISDWEHEGNYQQVELNNSIELEFTLNGEFIRVDHD